MDCGTRGRELRRKNTTSARDGHSVADARSAGSTRRRRAALAAAASFWLLWRAAAGAESFDARAVLDALPASGWVELTRSADGAIGGTRMDRVFPARVGHPAWAIVGPRAVMLAWGGGTYDPKRRLLVVTGGGHMDYGGNEVYAFSLDTLKWERLTDPSRYDSDKGTVDGTPISRHSYDGIEYLAGIDRIVMFGGSLYPHGNAHDPHAWLFDVDRRAWERRAAAPVSGFVGGATDAAGEVFYAYTGIKLLAWRARQDSWSVLAMTAHWHDVSMEFDPDVRRLMFVLRGGTGYFDLAAPGAARLQRPAPGGSDSGPGTSAGLAFDPVARRVLAWDGNRTVWALDSRAMRWAEHDNRAGAAPSRWQAEANGRRREKTRGIYGRWRYVPHLDAFVGVVASDDNVWLYRPPRN